MFHQAGVLYYLQEKLLMYLENVCNSKTTLRTALIKDLRNNKILLQLRALGLIGKLVTGPWMHHLYTNQAITNLESRTFIKTCLQNLNALKESPLLALQVKTDTFGVPLSPDSDAVLKKLQTAEIEELEKKELHCMLCLLIGGIVDVIQKPITSVYQVSFHGPVSVKPTLSVRCDYVGVHAVLSHISIRTSLNEWRCQTTSSLIYEARRHNHADVYAQNGDFICLYSWFAALAFKDSTFQ